MKIGPCESHLAWITEFFIKVRLFTSTGPEKQGPHLQVLAGTNSKFFWQPWVFQAGTLRGDERHSWNVALRLKITLVFCSDLYSLRPRLLELRVQGAQRVWSRRESFSKEDLSVTLQGTFRWVISFLYSQHI